MKSEAFQFSRRSFLRLAAGGVAGASLPAVAAQRPDFTYVVITDFHFRDERCAQWGERLLGAVRALPTAPAFVCLAGDLTDTGSLQEIGAMRELLRTLPMPVRPIIGNHDYDDAERADGYLATFGAALNYRFRVGEHEFVALDTTAGRGVYRTRIRAETIDWLARTLPQISRQRPLTVLTHFPLGRNYLRPWNAYQVLGMLRGHAFREAIAGHWHGLTRRVERGVPLLTNRCASWWRTNHDGSDERGFLLCSVRDGQTTTEFRPVSMTGLPALLA